MIKSPIGLQDLREKMSNKAKSEKTHKFWGLMVHVCKLETLQTAYKSARQRNGDPGIDRVSFEQIEQKGQEGLDCFLLAIQKELVEGTYYPNRYRTLEIPKGNGKMRTLHIPTIRDRVVQGAMKLILEPIFEADFQEGSFGYRPHRKASEALNRVSSAILQSKTTVIDLDIQSFFDNVRHHILLAKIAKRVIDPDILKMVKRILKGNGKLGLGQGGVLSPLFANLYLNDLDILLESRKQATSRTTWDDKVFAWIEYARWADDMIVLIYSGDNSVSAEAILQEIRVELSNLGLMLNEEKTKIVDLKDNKQTFSFLGFDFRRVKSPKGKWFPLRTPQMKQRTALLRKLKLLFQRYKSSSTQKLITQINPILRGWCNYFRVGHSTQCFRYVKEWVMLKVRRHLMRSKNLRGFGWKRWSTDWIFETLGLYNDFKIRYV